MPRMIWRNNLKSQVNNNRGQASILIGMMLMTFVLFFTFVINTGMLVNSKINLQNAADLAAYAGAATQARILNQVGYLNYEMRRQYKKFLFRYFVIGNMAQPTHPRSPGSGPRKWGVSGRSYPIPAVCVIFAASDNYCQLAEQPAISIPKPSPLDAINSTLIAQLEAIETIRQNNCNRMGQNNLRILLMWLYNTNPDLKSLITNTADPKEAMVLRNIAGISSGLGIVPREILLSLRIKTLADYLNLPAQKGYNAEMAAENQKAIDPAFYERPMQAFYSAFNTLGNHTFSDISMDELTPAQLFAYKTHKASFGTASVTFSPLPGAGNSCKPLFSPVKVENLPLGISKDPNILTYYALRLRAKARVMFSPFGAMELKAYAAAQPFGSRLGPPPAAINSASFTSPIGGGLNDFAAPGMAGLFSGFNAIPNMPVKEGGLSTGGGAGWETNEVIGAMYQVLSDAVGTAGQTSISAEGMERAFQAAMAPNPGEGFYYNIPNDLSNDPFVRTFDSSRTLAFWAPIFRPGLPDQTQVLKDELDRIFAKDAQDINPAAPANTNAIQLLKANLIKDLGNYLDKLRQGGGEQGEGMNVMRISDPFNYKSSTPGGKLDPIVLPQSIMIRDQDKIKTSWNEVNDTEFRKMGRSGYSVKFVSFKNLKSQKLSTNGTDSWTNDLNLDGEAEADIGHIKH